MSPIPRQGWFLNLVNFQNGISQNTGKCKLGGFWLRQSHITRNNSDCALQTGYVYILLLHKAYTQFIEY